MVKLKKAQASMRFFLVMGVLAILALIVVMALIGNVHGESSNALSEMIKQISGWGR